MKLLLLYGLPCSGKSTVLSALQRCQQLAVDSVITGLVDDPSLEDFSRLSATVVERLFEAIDATQFDCGVIEMGCLINQIASQWLHDSIVSKGWQVVNVKLHADDSVLIERILERNRLIESGESDSLVIDGPDYLTRFKDVFNTECPQNTLDIDTTSLTKHEVLEIINQLQIR